MKSKLLFSDKTLPIDIHSVEVHELTGTVGYIGLTTIAVVKINATEGIGIAICLPADKYSRDIGSGIAMARAIRNIGDIMEEVWISRSKPKNVSNTEVEGANAGNEETLP